MKLLITMLACLAITLSNISAEYITIAFDNASGYTNGWGDGITEGYGFDSWAMKSSGEQFTGTYVANTANNTELNYIWSLPGYQAWGMYANGGTEGEKNIAFRGFGTDNIWENKLDETGDSLIISMENNSVDGAKSAKTGFVLRHLNAKGGTGDYDTNARFEFGFVGGTSNYYIKDARGTNVNTGIGWRNSGFHLKLEITTNINSYSFTMIDAINDTIITNFIGTLASSGSIDSIALFIRDSIASGTDTYFNNMEIYDYFEPTLFIIK